MVSNPQISEITSLPFAHSESKTVGLRGPAMERLKDNACRVVGAGKITADALSLGGAALMGSASFGVGMVFSLISRFVMLGYGGKRNIHPEEIAPKKEPETFLGRVADDATKVFHPSKHPVEAASTWAMMGGMALAISGLFMPAGGLQAMLIGGLISFAEGGVVFGGHHRKKKEEQQKEQESLCFASSKSQCHGLTGKCGKALRAFKDTPEVRSGILQSATSLLTVSMGISWLAVNPLAGAIMIAAGALYLGSNLFYSAFVRKDAPEHDQHAEAQPTPPKTPSFVERLQAEQMQKALQPATGRSI